MLRLEEGPQLDPGEIGKLGECGLLLHEWLEVRGHRTGKGEVNGGSGAASGLEQVGQSLGQGAGTHGGYSEWGAGTGCRGCRRGLPKIGIDPEGNGPAFGGGDAEADPDVPLQLRAVDDDVGKLAFGVLVVFHGRTVTGRRGRQSKILCCALEGGIEETIGDAVGIQQAFNALALRFLKVAEGAGLRRDGDGGLVGWLAEAAGGLALKRLKEGKGIEGVSAVQPTGELAAEQWKGEFMHFVRGQGLIAQWRG